MHTQAIVMFKCYIFRISSLQLDPTIIERFRERCTLCYISFYQTDTNQLFIITDFNHYYKQINGVKIAHHFYLDNIYYLLWISQCQSICF